MYWLLIVSSCKNACDLFKHSDKHNSEPLYHCDHDDCNFSSRSMQSLRSHYKRVHEVRWLKLHFQELADLYLQEIWACIAFMLCQIRWGFCSTISDYVLYWPCRYQGVPESLPLPQFKSLATVWEWLQYLEILKACAGNGSNQFNWLGQITDFKSMIWSSQSDRSGIPNVISCFVWPP